MTFLEVCLNIESDSECVLLECSFWCFGVSIFNLIQIIINTSKVYMLSEYICHSSFYYRALFFIDIEQFVY